MALFLFSPALIALLCSTLAAAAPVCPIVGIPGLYTYDDTTTTGPSNWGSIPGFEKCATGTSQSPIDIPTSLLQLPTLSSPKFFYSNALMALKSKTENWSLDCKSQKTCGHMEYDGKRFNVVNIHFHAPSEHEINGVQYPLEAHIVHATDNGELGVLATMFNTGNLLQGVTGSNAVVETIVQNICQGQTTIDVPLDSILDLLGGYLSYSGSLTTPPCSEGVTFFMQENIRSASQTLVNNYIHTAGSPTNTNNRPVQPLNGRKITKFL